MWIIIIIGFAFIAFEILKPDSAPSDTKVSRDQTEENTEENKTYTEYLKQGDSALANNDYQNAIANFANAAKLNPTSTTPLMRLADSYLRSNQIPKAIDNFEKALAINPDLTDAKIGLVKSSLAKRDIESAKNSLWQLDANNPQVQYYKAITLILYKEFDQSKDIFTNLVANENTDTSIKNKSTIFLDKYRTFESFKEGEEVFLETLLAKAMTEVEEYYAAIPLLFDVIDQKNNYRDAWIVLGYAYLNINQIPDAIDAFTQARYLDDDKPETLFFLGLSYYANNEYQQATNYLEAAEKAGYPLVDQINLKLGELHLLKNNFTGAVERFEKVISTDPRNIDYYIKVVWLYIEKLRQPDRALQIAEQALKYQPNLAMSFNLKGWSLTALGEFTEAKKSLNQAISIDPDLDAAYLNLGWVYEKEGTEKLAADYYKKAYVLGSGNSISLLAAERFQKLTEEEINQYYQSEVSAP